MLDTSRDRDFILNQSEWPCFQETYDQFCCLKNQDNKRFGFLTSFDNPREQEKIVLSVGYIHNGGTGETVEYENVDKLLEDGWLVD